MPTSSRSGARRCSSPPKFPPTTETLDDNAAQANHSSIEHVTQTIDPRLLGAHADQLARSLSTPPSSRTLACNNDSASSKNDTFQNLSPITAVDQVAFKNDFDIEFEEIEGEQKHVELKSDAIPYLLAWSSQNNGQLPAGQQLECLEILTGTPKMILLDWLRVNVPNLPEQHSTILLQTAATDNLGQYQPRCLNSNSRYRSGQDLLRNARLFECTNRCGLSFHRKGGWARHERLNFEEWKCPSCPEVRSRWSHLHTHLKKLHDSEGIGLKIQPHYFVTAQQRPCGFCARDFDDWRQWLSHVAAHFEGTLHGGARRMSDWKERFRPHAAQREHPASGIDTVVDSEQFGITSVTYSTGRGPLPPLRPLNNAAPFGDSPDEYELSCRRFGRARCGTKEAKKYSMAVEGSAPIYVIASPPPSAAIEIQYGPSCNNYLEEDYDGVLVHAMAMLSVNEFSSWIGQDGRIFG